MTFSASSNPRETLTDYKIIKRKGGEIFWKSLKIRTSEISVEVNNFPYSKNRGLTYLFTYVFMILGANSLYLFKRKL